VHQALPVTPAMLALPETPEPLVQSVRLGLTEIPGHRELRAPRARQEI